MSRPRFIRLPTSSPFTRPTMAWQRAVGFRVKGSGTSGGEVAVGFRMKGWRMSRRNIFREEVAKFRLEPGGEINQRKAINTFLEKMGVPSGESTR